MIAKNKSLKKYRLIFLGDRKGETEIDFIAVNEIEKSIDFAEIKRQKTNIRTETLRQKAAEFLIQNLQFNSYKKDFYAWSLEDM